MTTHQQPPDELADLRRMMLDEHEVADRRGRPVDPVGRRRRRRALGITLSVIAVLFLSAGGYVQWALNAPLKPPVLTSEAPTASPGAAAGIALPVEGASALTVVGGEEYLGEGGISLTGGSDEARPIASISKLITALVILDAHPLADANDPGPTLTFDKADHDLYDAYYVQGATIASMPTGSSMSLHDALATMLIPSASNYAEAVSTWAFGSQNEFVRATRDWLASQGLTGTTIVEPTGLSPRNTSTPADLLAIAKIAAANPAIAAIASTPTLTLPGPGFMANTNDLLGRDGITGLKTGNLGEGTYSLLYTATVDVGAASRLSVTGVVLGGFSRESVDQSVLQTLSTLREGFHDVPVATSGQQVGSMSTPWGATAQLVIGESESIRTWSDTPITVSLDLETPTAYADGEVVGTLTWTAGPKTSTADVRIAGSIEPPTSWWRLTHPTELGGG